jgi:thiol-disulfide isomerase/thioredoxin
MVGYSARMHGKRLLRRECRSKIAPRATATVAAGMLGATLCLLACGGEAGRSDAAASPASAPAPTSTSTPTTAGSAPSDPVGAARDASVEAAPVTQAAPLGPVHQIEVLDLDGRRVSLGTLAGRPMIIEIWATWCGPCRKNRETVHRLEPRFPEKLAVVGVSVDAGSAGRSPAETVRAFLRSNPANEFEFLATPAFLDFIKERNPSSSIPKTLYVDSKGRVADLSEGVQSAKWLEAMARNLK